MDRAKHIDIIRAFGLPMPRRGEPESIYPHAPVYRVRGEHEDWILKRTRAPLSAGESIAAWTRSMVEAGIHTVCPVEGFGANPRAFPSGEGGAEEVWVVYPFIEGEGYRGGRDQLEAAGSLLGRIHEHGHTTECGLKVREEVVSLSRAQVAESAAQLFSQVEAVRPEKIGVAKRLFEAREARYFDEALPRLAGARLPLSSCSWDYKAGNLIFESTSRPVLIDPDSGGRIPRAYDLAIAAFLFPDNAPDAPRRALSRREWLSFLKGYGRRCVLSEIERSLWPELVSAAWMDEALWLLADYKAGWEDPIERRWLWSLLTVDHSVFALP